MVRRRFREDLDMSATRHCRPLSVHPRRSFVISKPSFLLSIRAAGNLFSKVLHVAWQNSPLLYHPPPQSLSTPEDSKATQMSMNAQASDDTVYDDEYIPPATANLLGESGLMTEPMIVSEAITADAPGYTSKSHSRERQTQSWHKRPSPYL